MRANARQQDCVSVPNVSHEQDNVSMNFLPTPKLLFPCAHKSCCGKWLEHLFGCADDAVFLPESVDDEARLKSGGGFVAFFMLFLNFMHTAHSDNRIPEDDYVMHSFFSLYFFF